MRGSMRIGAAMLVMVLAMTWLSVPMPSLAQTTGKIGPCWERVDACIQRHVNQSSTNPEFDSRSPKFNPRKLLCCPLIQEIARAELPCFCSIGPALHHTPQGANLTRSLLFCDAIDSLASFDTTCKGVTPSPTNAPRSPPASNSTRSPTRSPPGSTPRPPTKTPSGSPPSATPSRPTKTPSGSISPPSSTSSPTQSPAMSPQGQKGDGSCWQEIGSCLTKHVAQRKSNPKLNPESKSFNQTEFFCCPLIQQAAKTDKLCFCAIAPAIHQNPTNFTSLFNILNACNVSDSLASLDAMCSPGSTPSPTASTPAPAMSPSGNPIETSELSPPAGILPSSASPAGAQSGKASSPKSASTKNSMMGSLSGVLILLASFLYY